MKNWPDGAGIELRPVYPEEILIDGKSFDPHAHFRDWREKHEEWRDKKQDRKDKALERAKELQGLGKSFSEIAETLNTKKS